MSIFSSSRRNKKMRWDDNSDFNQQNEQLIGGRDGGTSHCSSLAAHLSSPSCSSKTTGATTKFCFLFKKMRLCCLLLALIVVLTLYVVIFRAEDDTATSLAPKALDQQTDGQFDAVDDQREETELVLPPKQPPPDFEDENEGRNVANKNEGASLPEIVTPKHLALNNEEENTSGKQDENENLFFIKDHELNKATTDEEHEEERHRKIFKTKKPLNLGMGLDRKNSVDNENEDNECAPNNKNEVPIEDRLSPDQLADIVAKQVERARLVPDGGTVWPLPQKIVYGHENRTVRKNGVVVVFRGPLKESECDILHNLKQTYMKRWFFPTRFHERLNGGSTVTLAVSLKRRCPAPTEFPQFEMNEEYHLKVPETGEATLEADEIWGILRGMETFSQLLFKSGAQYWLRTGEVHDWPEYPVRGVLLDTSRHYLSPTLLKRQLDLMAQNKMNLLHWHIVDMDSFPYVSLAFPNLTKGAFTPRHVYTPSIIQDVLRHARLRGIRVMVEFDTPGHMGSWAGQSGLLAQCFDKNGTRVQPAMIDPCNERNFDFLRDFFREVLALFPDKWLHLGGDEAWYWTEQCWARNPEIIKFMREHQFVDTDALEHYYIGRLQALVRTEFDAIKKRPSEQRRMLFWDEVAALKPDPTSTIIHLWSPRNGSIRTEALQNLTRDGYEVILSSCWYLNLIQYGADWAEGKESKLGEGPYYGCDPRGFNGTDEEKRRVLGGIATMWGEFVDGTNVEARLWPRASAVAERLWSPPELTREAVRAWPRLHEHRCRMIARGYRAEPINGPDYCTPEWDDPDPAVDPDPPTGPESVQVHTEGYRQKN